MNRQNRKYQIEKFIVLGMGMLAVFAFSAFGCDEEEEEEKLQTVTYEINDEVDFAQYETFSIVNPLAGTEGEDADAGVEDGGVSDAPFGIEDINAEVLAEIETQMTGLGMTVDDSDPNLMVTYYAKKESYTDPVTFYDYYYGPYWGYEYTWTMEVEYDVGTMIVDVVDLGTSADSDDDLLVFRGIAEGVFGQDPGFQLLQVRNAVYAVFQGWPAK